MKPYYLLILLLTLTACSTTGTGAKWYAPATWFSHAPATAADKAKVAEVKAQAVVDTTVEKATRAAHVEIAKADVVGQSLPPSRATDLSRRFVSNGLDLLDQVQPLTAAEAAELRAVVSGLLSQSAETVAAAEKKQAQAESEASRLSRELTEAQVAANDAGFRADQADAKLRKAFDTENTMANALRAQYARFWVAVGVIVLLLAFSMYAKMQLGGIGAALHAAGVPLEVMSQINEKTSSVGQWMIRKGRLAAAKLEAADKAHAASP